MIKTNNIQIKKIDKSNQNYKDTFNSGNYKFSYLGNWLEKESTIFKNEGKNIQYNKPNFKYGEIIKVDFGINIGSELSNTHFAIVLNSDDNNSTDNITVIPLTSKKGYKRVNVGNILKDFNKDKKYSNEGYALITQITTISKNKIFKTKVKSFCNKETMNLITQHIIEYLSDKKIDCHKSNSHTTRRSQ